MDRATAKKALVATLVEKLDNELANMKRAAKDAREAATHEEAKPENDKDTRALEASYLAGAQAARVRELDALVLAAAGSSDPLATQAVGRLARTWGARHRLPVTAAFASTAPPATGEAVREFGNVSRPNSSMSECSQSCLPSGVKAVKTPSVN